MVSDNLDHAVRRRGTVLWLPARGMAPLLAVALAAALGGSACGDGDDLNVTAGSAGSNGEGGSAATGGGSCGAASAVGNAMPTQPSSHPRLFVTPEQFESVLKPRIEQHYSQQWAQLIGALDPGCPQCNPYYAITPYAMACYMIDQLSIDAPGYSPHPANWYCEQAVDRVINLTSCTAERHEYSGGLYGDHSADGQPRGCGLNLALSYTLLMGSADVDSADKQALTEKVYEFYGSPQQDTIQYCISDHPQYEGNRNIIVNSAFPYCFQHALFAFVLYGDETGTVPQTQQEHAWGLFEDTMLNRLFDYQQAVCGPSKGDDRYGSAVYGWCDHEGGAYEADNYSDTALAAAAFGPGLGVNLFRDNQWVRQLPEALYNRFRLYSPDGRYHKYTHDDGNLESAKLNCKDDCDNTLGRAMRLVTAYGDAADPMVQLAAWIAESSPLSVEVDVYAFAHPVESYPLSYIFGGSAHVAGASPSELSWPLLSRDGSFTLMRTGFDAGAASVAVQDTEWLWPSTHNKHGEGGIYIDRKGPLVVSGTATKSGPCERANNGAWFGPAHHSMTGFVTSPAMHFNGIGGFKAAEMLSGASLVEGGTADIGERLAFDTFGTTLVSAWDYANAYDVTRAEQHLVLFNEEPAGSIVVELNHLVGNAERVKVLRVPREQAVVPSEANTTQATRLFSVTNSFEGAAHIHLVYPTAPTLEVSGSPDIQDITGVGLEGAPDSIGNELCKNYLGDYTIRVRTDESVFVTVYDLVDVGGAAHTPQAIGGSDVRGVLIDGANQDHAAVVALSPNAPTLSFTAPLATTTEIVVSGLMRCQQYDVAVGGTSLTVNSSRGGVAHFEVSGSGLQTVQLSAAGEAPCEPYCDNSMFMP